MLGFECVDTFSALQPNTDQTGFLKNPQVPTRGLPAVIHPSGDLARRLRPAVGQQGDEDRASSPVGERTEQGIEPVEIRQPWNLVRQRDPAQRG